ncbi:serine protease [Catenovulum sp. 2E275]|uniref:S1C family serine protease n=1 Tax=Catenovulum sp. 2E275 TaxID=2980497 RepID=UPI0021D2D308|nr:serine protease [Catenovulum sp. 2E275]MCU4676406.1 serine protease [Catenovulum sp. 2E275]
MKFKHLSFFYGLCFVLLSKYSFAQNNADTLFQEYEKAVFQVQLIEKNSNKKSAIGSGFVIQQGQIITNYHVVSAFIHSPDQYRIELLTQDSQNIPAQLINFDVINDLAILKAELHSPIKLSLANSHPNQGEDIFSIGNPHDFGMIVSPGTYNGITAHSFYQRINFTGSINPGMSGGPVLNRQGEIIGVNVATAGNQLGFLVPLVKLTDLLDKTSTAIQPELYNQQIYTSQQNLYETLLNKDWPAAKLGQAVVLNEIAPFIPCWGQSNAENEKAQFSVSEINCASKEKLYLSHNFQSGNIEIQFSWLDKEKLNAIQFSQLLEASFSHAGPGNAATKKHVTNYHCNQSFTQPNNPNASFKTTYCVRNYKKYPSLYDVLLMAVSVHDNQKALMSHFTLSGVSQENAQAFSEKFLGAVQWN